MQLIYIYDGNTWDLKIHKKYVKAVTENAIKELDSLEIIKNIF